MTDDVVRERALVRSGWELVDTLNHLGPSRSRQLFRHRWDAEAARATANMPTLEPGIVDNRFQRAYESPTNRVRFQHTLDHLLAGDRIFDIGLGRGYMGGVLVRDDRVTSYRGIDLVESNVRSTRRVLHKLEAGDSAHVDVGDLYDLTRDDVENSGADLVICCEVIEHVPDPEAAMKTLAAALPTGSELLFSVPLLGRLEAVWGHVAFFDAARVHAMTKDAGLIAHEVTPVANTWAFVLASADPKPSPRASAAADAYASSAPDLTPQNAPTATESIDLTSIDVSAARHHQLDDHAIDIRDGVVHCALKADQGSDDAASSGGIRLPVSRPRGVRVEIELEPLDAVRGLTIDAYDRSSRVARWAWDPAEKPSSRKLVTAALRPGRHGDRFVPRDVGKIHDADTLEIVAEVAPGSEVNLRLHRADIMR